MRRKINNIHCEDIFNSSQYIYGSSFKWFSEGDNELECDQPLMLISPGIYSLRHTITHKVLYSNLSRGLPFLECLSTSVGIKVTDNSFRTILILNSLIVTAAAVGL